MSEVGAKHGINPWIHGARGLFCLMVFIYHVHHSQLGNFAPLEGFVGNYILGTGNYGVELFFGISGFVIIGAMGRSRSAAGFLFDRAVRIWPALWVALVAFTGLLLAAHKTLPTPLPYVANFFTPLPVFGVTMVHPAAWSLGYEFNLYLGCAVLFLLRDRPRVALAALCAFIFILITGYPRALLMLAGIAIAYRLGERPQVLRLARHPALFLALYLLTWRSLELWNGEKFKGISPYEMGLPYWLAHTPILAVAGLCGWLALLGISRGEGGLSALLKTRPMQWLGTISYSFYLWHPIVLAVVKQLMLKLHLIPSLGDYTQLAFAALSLPPALAMGHLSQRVIEARFTRWVKQQVRSRPAPAVGASLPAD